MPSTDDPPSAAERNPSALLAKLLLRRYAPLLQPVSVARTLSRYGLGLRRAHDILHRLAAGETVPVRLPPDHAVDALVAELRPLGVEGCRSHA